MFCERLITRAVLLGGVDADGKETINGYTILQKVIHRFENNSQLSSAAEFILSS